ncbi:hypothetical protein SAMN02910317_03075 [Ruminococcaceae bacterium FB2012]|nr:hypothetical protein SAMN02910317_03075 [Ruminococcaceae bacterium FB2012]
MDNYKLYANLIRKPDSSDFNARPCVVEKWIPLSHWSFEQIKQDPLHDLEAVKAYRDIMFCDNEANHCIMLLDDLGSDGILVESEGYDYPRYSCFVPNARTLYEDSLTTNAERELRGLIRKAADKALEDVFADNEADIHSADLIDEDEVSRLVKTAIVERLNQHPGINEARCLSPWIPEQPDIDIKTEPLKKIKFYCPLKIMQIPDEDDYMDLDDYDGEPEDLPSYCALTAAGDINIAIEEYASPCEEDRGIMAYLGGREMLGKVYSIFPSVEKMDNDFWGVFECKVFEDLDSYELEALRLELSGQASDGWGEGFEQREIETDDCGKLYVSFYGAPDWSMKTEEEMGIPANEVQDLDDGDISM